MIVVGKYSRRCVWFAGVDEIDEEKTVDYGEQEQFGDKPEPMTFSSVLQ